MRSVRITPVNSDRIELRVSKDMFKWLSSSASFYNISVQQFIRLLIQSHIDKEKII